MINDVLQLCTTIGGAEEQACDGPDVSQTKDLHDKTGDLISDLKISSDWRRNKYALEVHTNSSSLTVRNSSFSNSSRLTVRKGYGLAISFWGFYRHGN